jgi:NAD+ synthase (glutamine-hydrolysing)
MGTEYSSEKTRKNASDLATDIGAYHLNTDIGKIFQAFKDSFKECFHTDLKFLSENGTLAEDMALQNLQARIRMTLSYMLAGLVTWTRKRKGFLLVLASGNLDEGMMGYLTKYDCSSADINPIGSISKRRLNAFLKYCYSQLDFKSLKGILDIVPTAELRPNVGDKAQSDEEDIGITYEELSLMGQLRKDYRCGPYSMFRRLITIWTDRSTEFILEKVKLFFRKYSINRHKMTTITPSLHCESYSLDDNRYDLRQFLYNPDWVFQFKNIEKFKNNNKNIIDLDEGKPDTKK